MRFVMRRTGRAVPLALPVALAALALASPGVWADDVAAGMATKFSRGLVNVATGWLELPKEWVEQSKANPAIGWATGTFTGIGKTVYRTAAGVYETAFFSLPAPPRHMPVIEPNTVFGEVRELR